MSSEIKITLNIGGEIIENSEEISARLEEIRKSRGAEYIQSALGGMEITPDMIVQVPQEEVQLGYIRRQLYDIDDLDPVFKTPDLSLYFGISPEGMNVSRSDFFTFEDSDVLVEVHYDAYRGAKAKRDPKEGELLTAELKDFVASELTKVLE